MPEILYADEHIAVVIKPRGILSQEAGENSLPALLKQRLDIQSIFTVHRLDKEVGGVMVYALTPKAAAALSRTVQNRQMDKRYLAVLQGIPQEPAAVLEDLLFHDQRRNKTFVVDRQRKGVKDARLEYSVLQTVQGQSLVQVRLHTGRTHQIRVQFASRRLPLAGDGKYGGRGPEAGFGLWCQCLCFPHPVTGEMLTFSQNPPPVSPWDIFTIN